VQKMFNEKTNGRLRLLNGLHEIAEDSSTVLFIRHGDRNNIPDGEFGNEIELNEVGILRSHEYGKALASKKINKIYTSPVTRCVQTAELIARGTGKEARVEQSSLLGQPGAFIYDEIAAGNSFMQMGANLLFERLLAGIRVEGNYPIVDGATTLSEFFQKETGQPGISIYVSHDLIIALYAYATFQKKYTIGSEWINYLDGLIIQL